MILKYFLTWFGMMILAILNGGLRENFYKSRVGDLTAHQISTVILLILFTIYFRFLTSIWPIHSSNQAWIIGLMWFLMTLAFEMILGHFIMGNTWSKVLQEYKLFSGRIWILIPLWTLIGPYVLFWIRQSQ